MLNGLDTKVIADAVEAIKAAPNMGGKTVKSRSVWKGGYQVETTVNDFKIVVDEPCVLGGTNVAATPTAYLLGAFGACYSIIFVFLATMKGIEIEELALEVEANLDIPGFLAVEDDLKTDKVPGFTGINTKVIVKSKASNDELKKISERASDFSPVGQSLIRPVVVKMEID